MSPTSLLAPFICSKISSNEDNSDDCDYSNGGGGVDKGDGDEKVIADEEENEMERLMKAEEFH